MRQARAQARNRLVAAMADSVVVTEGSYRCPAIKIAQRAVRLGVPVGAVPGPITSVTSAGTNGLLHRRVARVITHATDAMDLITVPPPGRATSRNGRPFLPARVVDARSPEPGPSSRAMIPF